MLFKVFESGKYPQGDFTPQMVEQMAFAYSPESDVEAPCVIGHLDNSLAERIENELADGWIKELSFRQFDGGKAELWADCELSENLKQLIASKRIRYVSAEIAKREEDSLYLVRLAFLGRSIPAVATARVPAAFRWIGAKFGLRFEEQNDEGLLRFCRKLEFVGQELNEPKSHNAPETTENKEENNNFEEGEMAKITQEQLELEQAKAAKFQQEAEATKAELAKFRQEQEKKDVELRLSSLRDSGKLAPAEFEQAAGLALQLHGEYREQYFKQIENRPPILDVSGKEHATTSNAQEGQTGSMNQTEQVRKFAKENGISFTEAAQKMAAQNPAQFGGQ